MNILPLDIIREIVSHIKNNLIKYRTINKAFKQIIDNDMIENGINIIVTANMMKEIINKIDDYFDCVLVNTKIVPIYEKYIRCKNVWMEDGLSLWFFHKTNTDLKLRYYNNMVYFTDPIPIDLFAEYFIFLPTSKIINYFLNIHTLSRNNKFNEHSLKNTLEWYIKKIKELNSQNNDYIIKYYKSKY